MTRKPVRTTTGNRIIIIGAVAAGTSAAAKARRNNENAIITLYDADRYISYSGCGLPYYIGGRVRDIKELTPRDPAFFEKKYGVTVKIRHRVEAIDTTNRSVRVRNLETGKVFDDSYDTLVIATGSDPVRLTIPGVDLPHVFTLRNPADAVAIRTFVEDKKPQTAVIIGTGFIGLETADNLSLRGIGITLIEKLPNICPSIDPDMAAHLLKHLTGRGVRVESGRIAVAIKDSSVILDDGTEIPANIVISAVGVRPNVALAKDAGIRLGVTGAIAVDEAQRTNLPNVYACGDCTENYFVLTGMPFYRPLGSTANKTGRITGDVITGGDFAHRGVLGTAIFETFGMTVASTGLSEKLAREQGFDVLVSINTKPHRPEYLGGREMVIKAIVDRKTHMLLGVQIVGFDGVDKRMDVFVTAMTALLRVEDLFHLDLAYAPPFSTTKDPVMYTGMILENALDRGRELISERELSSRKDKDLVILDMRAEAQFNAGHVPGARNVPHEKLRDTLCELDPKKPVVTYCNKGTTGNAAQNILLNSGFGEVYNLTGGFKHYSTNQSTTPVPDDREEDGDEPNSKGQP
ncbi:MAG: FAD-dependent oxidoreductase [Clostridiaceae bacterium]|nr:FAD-dependent oxidoreductase [Clostridiaceae bacterium]